MQNTNPPKGAFPAAKVLPGGKLFFDYLRSLTSTKAQKKALVSLRDYLGPDRKELPLGYMSEQKYLDAYLRYYLPLHLPELAWILTQYERFYQGPQSGDRVLDLGSGPGTLSLAFSLYSKLKGISDLEFTLVDQSKGALEEAKSLLKLTNENLAPFLWVHDVARFQKFKGAEPFDWIFSGHMLNEWGSDSVSLDLKKKFLDSVMKNLMHERSVFVIVEPPLREPTMDLMKLRDFWSRELGGHVLLPCPAETQKCPALKSRLGWCYSKFSRSWARELGWAAVDENLENFLGQELHYNGFSYLVLAAEGADMEHFAGFEKNRRVAFSDERRKPSMWCRESKIATSSRRPKHRGELISVKPSEDET